MNLRDILKEGWITSDPRQAYVYEYVDQFYNWCDVTADDALDVAGMYEYDYEDDKSYASIPEQTQTYSAPAAAVSPEMAEAMEKFSFWTQEEIQGYFDQGWSVQQLEEWLENQ